jgi:REP element-mobilizing transposase RayT
MPNSGTPWPHAPSHQLSEGGTYFVTAGTYLKAHYFRGADRLAVLHRGLLTVARDYGWLFEAWAVFSNHYHFVSHSPPNAPVASSLPEMLSTLHVKTAKWVNKLDHRPGSRGLVQLSRNAAYLPEVLSSTVKLRSSKCRKTRAGTGSKPISVVLGRMV